MAFGKRKPSRQEPILEENYEGDVGEHEDNNIVEETQSSNTDQSSSRNSHEQAQESQEIPMNSDIKPLLNEVIIASGAQGKNSGGTKTWTCKHCNIQFKSSYTRIHYHFFGNLPGKKSEIRRCQSLINNREEYERVRRMVMEAEKKGVSSSLKSSTILRQQPQKSTAGALDDMFKIMDKNSVDMKVMRGLCANGIPFNVLRNPQFHEMISAINHAPQGYKAPSSEKARTTLLDECKRSLEKELAPVKDTWFTHGVSIVSDGWSNMKHEPLINIIAANSRGALFLYAQDFSGIQKTGEVIADFMLTAIEDVGSSNVLQIVTDNAKNCESAGREIEKVHKHIFWSPCVVHTLNLIFKDLAKEFDWFRQIYNIGKAIVKFFLNHSHALAMFRSHSKLELLKVAKTRFESHYILLKRLIDCKEALASTVILQKWKDWVKTLDPEKRKLGENITQAVLADNFWDDVLAIVNITKPIYFLIKYCDGDGQKMGEIYERMDNMLGEIREVMSSGPHSNYFPQVEKIVLQRWQKKNYPIHCVGYALTPRFYDRAYLSKKAPGGFTRKSPNQDIEVITSLMEAFDKISEDREEAEVLRQQYAIFHQRKGIFATQAVQTDAVTMDAIDWWSTYGSQVPQLAEVAQKVLAQPVSSSSAERNWSTYSYIHNVKRNRLNAERADKLVFIHSNIRLLSRFSEGYNNGTYKRWDINPESTEVDDSPMRLEDLRWRMLDRDYVDEEESSRTKSTSSRPVPPILNAQLIRPGTHQTDISRFAKARDSSGT
ncbi:uncharacterized protein LOC133728490 [Rosa rugosa]|uniref:uncharacterized protein LOC133728490 n=1 Tax=Rosa rugosa TaxID=74645 RepID=UPI002B403F3E|nr:uncharacterized protein LOC133728490 [Rosa rugosa]